MTAPPILVATDLGDTAERLLRKAKDIARRLDQPLEVLQVIPAEDMEALREASPPGDQYVDMIVQRVRDELTARVREVVDVDAARVMVSRGDPADQIVQAAEDRSAEMLVIGVRNRSRVGKLLFGSVAQPVLLRAPCPVLAVPV